MWKVLLSLCPSLYSAPFRNRRIYLSRRERNRIQHALNGNGATFLRPFRFIDPICVACRVNFAVTNCDRCENPVCPFCINMLCMWGWYCPRCMPIHVCGADCLSRNIASGSATSPRLLSAHSATPFPVTTTCPHAGDPHIVPVCTVSLHFFLDETGTV